MLKIECSAITDIGLVRRNNEDNYYINGKVKASSGVNTEGYIDNKPRDSYLYAVCDGMGTESFGELASMIAVKTLTQFQSTDIHRTIKKYVQTANKFICDEMNKYNVKIGTTLALLYIRDNYAFSCNVGNSRVYLYRNGDLFLLSEDHTEAQRLVVTGIIKQEDADRHNARYKLTQFLGIPPDEMAILPYISEEVKLKKKDVLLVCSDGLTDMVSDDDIADSLSDKRDSATDMVKILASKTQANGGKDNTSIIVVKVS